MNKPNLCINMSITHAPAFRIICIICSASKAKWFFRCGSISITDLFFCRFVVLPYSPLLCPSSSMDHLYRAFGLVYNNNNYTYRVFIKYCVVSWKFCDYSELCQFCCSAGVLPAWYDKWQRGKTEKGHNPKYYKILNTIFYEHHIPIPTKLWIKDLKNHEHQKQSFLPAPFFLGHGHFQHNGLDSGLSSPSRSQAKLFLLLTEKYLKPNKF